MASKWIGVDLDGTLAELTDNTSGAIGDPVPAMVKRVKDWTAAGREVRIFTARGGDQQEVTKVKAWLKANGLGDLAVTNVKDQGLVELWDDRAIKVKRNTGTACSGCLNLKRQGYSHQDHGTDTDLNSTDLTDC